MFYFVTKDKSFGKPIALLPSRKSQWIICVEPTMWYVDEPAVLSFAMQVFCPRAHSNIDQHV